MDEPITQDRHIATSRAPRPTNRMRAAVIAGPSTLRLDRIDVPEPSAGEVRIRLEGCGVCGSNLPVWEGRPWFEYPLAPGAPGHEGWGVVDAVGEGVPPGLVGRRVAALSQAAFAEVDVADAGAVVPLPRSLDGQPFPGEPLGCAMNVFRRTGIVAGETVAVVGVGFLGALLVQLAVSAGARVIAITRRRSALEVAGALGAHELILMDDHWRILDEVKSLTGGEGCHCVIEAVGLQWPLDLAAELTRVRGRLVVAGYHQDGPRQVNMQSWNWRGIDVINAHERDPAIYRQGIEEAVDAVAGGRLDPSPLYTHTFPLDELDAALTMMQERPDGFMKALITL
jgi:threonine dehydrogenase-like Zn-dependent dehydrogenase